MPVWVQLGPWAAGLLVLVGAVLYFDRRLTRVERDVVWIPAALRRNGFTAAADEGGG